MADSLIISIVPFLFGGISSEKRFYIEKLCLNRDTMTSTTDSPGLPEELHQLGELRQIFESTGLSVLGAVWRGLFPMLVAAGLFVAAEIWLVPRTWKYYSLVALAGLTFLNGIRVVVIALTRRQQKLATFEKGFAHWRNTVLTYYRWDQVDYVDTSEAFFGFTIHCRSDDGTREKIHFDRSSDPTGNLRGLWREVEEQSAQTRIPEMIRQVDAGKEVHFVRTIWGKEVGTKAGISSVGIRAKPRYLDWRYLEWDQVVSVAVDGERLRVSEVEMAGPWLDESILEMPGYATLVAVAEHARLAYLSLSEQLHQERLPTLFAAMKTEHEERIGAFGVSKQGLRHENDLTPWENVYTLSMEFDHLEVHDDLHTAKRKLDVSQLTLADRLILKAVADHAWDLSEAEGEETREGVDAAH